MAIKKLLILLCAVFLSLAVAAQERVVTGRVADKDGQPIPGVHIVVKGTASGAISDEHGNYSISAPEGAVLLFSSIGLGAQEQAVGNRSVLDVSMSDDIKELSEVVV